MRFNILWDVAVARHSTTLRTKFEVDHFMVLGGSKGFDRIEVICEAKIGIWRTIDSVQNDSD